MKKLIIIAIAIVAVLGLSGAAYAGKTMLDSQKATAAAAQKQAKVAQAKADAATKATQERKAAAARRKSAHDLQATLFAGAQPRIEKDIRKRLVKDGYTVNKMGCQVEVPLHSYECYSRTTDEYGSYDTSWQARVDAQGGFIWETTS